MSGRLAIVPAASAVKSAEARAGKYDWQKLSEELSGSGCAVMEKLLSPEECQQIATLYPREDHFRSHVAMARHGFGKGEYRYFKQGQRDNPCDLGDDLKLGPEPRPRDLACP
jgi:uncharacterized protein